MKRIALYALILTMLVGWFGLPQSYTVEADENIFTLSSHDVSEDTTEIKLTLNVSPKYGYKVVIKLPEEISLSSSRKEDVLLKITASGDTFTKKGDAVTLTVSHEALSSGRWEGKLPIKYQYKAYIQTKTVYSSTTVAGWDYNNVSLSKPSGDYITKTQYGYKEVTGYDTGNYSLERPNGPCEERVQYSYKTRTKDVTYTTESRTYEKFYNNIGVCPIECIEGTIIKYDTGCQCTLRLTETTRIPHVNYGDWTDSGEWRFDTPYTEDDVTQPISRTVYLLPSGYGGETGWRDSPYEAAGNIIPISRTVYISPSSYTTSEWSDEYPSSGTVNSKTVCRFEKNGVWSAWTDCN